MREFPQEAIDRAKDGAASWLESHDEGFPRSWAQEDADDKRRGYVMYEDFEAPPIAGYEALEREGRAERLGIVLKGQCERVRFRKLV